MSNGTVLGVSETHPVWLANKKKWGAINLVAANKKFDTSMFASIEPGDSVIFYESSHGKFGAASLTVGGISQSSHETVSVVEIKPSGIRVEMYDLINTSPGNTFLANGVLVHNTTMSRPPERY